MQASLLRPSLCSPPTWPFSLHHRHRPITISASIQSNSTTTTKPIVVVGSANADLFLELDRLPLPGETVSAKTGFTLAGGKGANQACCAALLDHPTTFIGQIGDDVNGTLIADALDDAGVGIERLVRVGDGVPTGNAVVMLQPNGQNSIVIVGGANVSGWPQTLRKEDEEVVRNAGVVLLQREIPDFVNVQVVKAAKSAGVPVILDAGGMEGPVPQDLLNLVDILSPNEIELARLTGKSTESFDHIAQAVSKLHEMGVKQVLVKLGDKGSALFAHGEKPQRQPIIPAPKILDTTGAGDTYTAAFAVSLIEGKPKEECLKFAAAAASLCVQVKGAIPSMPRRDAVVQLLQSVC